VLIDGNRIELVADAQSRGAIDLPAAAASVKVDIRNASGTVVRTLELGARAAGPSLFEWDGKTDDGATAAPGGYTYSARAVSGGAEMAAGTLMAARVDGVRNDGGAIQLMLKGVGTVAYADIKQIL
jgi:flagellar basal-body rod modification protein FlgD